MTPQSIAVRHLLATADPKTASWVLRNYCHTKRVAPSRTPRLDLTNAAGTRQFRGKTSPVAMRFLPPGGLPLRGHRKSPKPSLEMLDDG